MKIINIRKYASVALLLLLATSLFTSCDEEYLVFDTGNPGIYFTKDTLEYSFSVTPAEIKRYTYKVPVKIMAATSKETRPIGYEVNSEYTNAIEGVHYEFGDAVILPDSINGFIPVTFIRENLEGSYATGYTRYSLCLELVENGFFAPTLDSLNQVRILRFDNAVEQPAWYTAHGTKHWPEELGSWHPYTFIKMIEYFHLIEQLQPETYYKMVEEYGENLENVPNGYFTKYEVTMKKYVFNPLYIFTNDPANRQDILKEFPDYPFDIPNPYDVDDDPIN